MGKRKRKQKTKARAETRQSLENPVTSLSDPDAWFWDALGGQKSAAGVRVNRKSALTYAAYWRGVNLIATTIAKTPLITYRKQDNGSVRDRQHPVYKLLKTQPHRHYTPFTFKQTIQNHVITHGNGYAYIHRGRGGRPEALSIIEPTIVEPILVDGKLQYHAFTDAGDGYFDPETILHIKGMGYDGLQGYSVLEYGRETLGIGMALREFGARWFSNATKYGTIIEHPGQLTEDAQKRLKASIERDTQAVSDSHNTKVLEEGMKLHAPELKAKDAQLLESREFELREIANLLGLPPHKLGDTTRTSFASLEQENQAFLDDSLDGWFVAWEEECERKLLTDAERDADSHDIEFLRQSLVRVDMTTRADYYSKGLAGAPFMTINDVRSRENLNEINEPEAQRLPMPLNISSPDDDNDGGGDDDNDGDGDDARARAVEHELRRCVRRIGNQASRKVRRLTPDEYAEWVAGLPGDEAGKLRDSLEGLGIHDGQDEIVEALAEEIRAALTECRTVDDVRAAAEGVEDTVGSTNATQRG